MTTKVKIRSQMFQGSQLSWRQEEKGRISPCMNFTLKSKSTHAQVSRHPDSTCPKSSLGTLCLIYFSVQHLEDKGTRSPSHRGETEGRSCLLSQGSEGKEQDSNPQVNPIQSVYLRPMRAVQRPSNKEEAEELRGQ